MEKFCSFFCSVEKYGPLILLSVQYMVEPFCLTNFSATSHSTHPVPAVPSQAGRKSEPFLSFFITCSASAGHEQTDFTLEKFLK